MARRFTTIGTGITQRRVTSYSGEDMAPHFKRWAASWNAAFEAGGGTFGAQTLDLIQECEALLGTAAGPHDPDSEADFAERLAELHRLATGAIEQSEADRAARLAYELGYLHAQAVMKHRHEQDALAGQRFRESGNKGGRPRNPEIARRDREFALEVQRRSQAPGNRSRTSLIEEIGARHGLKSMSAAHAAFKRGQRILSDEQGSSDGG